MDHGFWLERWADGRIGFHEPQGNTLLRAHLSALGLRENARIFVPLAGKSRDIGWLHAQGFAVAAVELSQTAVDQLFEDLGVAPKVSREGRLLRHSVPGIDVFVGDFFALDAGALGAVDAVCDRAALVALPEAMRGRYAAHLAAMTARAPQLLITFEYDQTAMAGPPFSVDAAEVARHYAERFVVEELARTGTRLRGLSEATETVWALRPR